MYVCMYVCMYVMCVCICMFICNKFWNVFVCVFVVQLCCKLEHFFGGKFLQLSFDSNEKLYSL